MNPKKASLRTKIISAVTIPLIVMTVALGMALTQQSRKAMKTLISDHVLDIVRTAASMIDADDLNSINGEEKGAPAYDRVYNTLASFDRHIGLEFIYAVRKIDDGYYIFVVDPALENASAYGEEVYETEALRRAAEGTASVDADPYRDNYGYFYSAYCPVLDDQGQVAGVVAADFDAAWYESQINKYTNTVIAACILFAAIGVLISIAITRQYIHQLDAIDESMVDLANDLDSITNELVENGAAPRQEVVGDVAIGEASKRGDRMQALAKRISVLRDGLREYVTKTTTQANAMITAMASDYRSLYHVNLDEDDAVCYRSNSEDGIQSPEGVHFAYLERFVRYGEEVVAESYRDGFLAFIDPDNIRDALATEPIIAYRYLARQGNREYYEMIRMAGVRRAQDRDDGMVHAVGLGFTIIDEEMRKTLAHNEALAEALVMADEANKAKTAFLSNMSHEIRTPMNAIIGLNTLALQDDSLTDQTRGYLEKTGASARHLLGLINDILDMSRIESGRLVLRREEFSLSAMLEQINTMVMSQCSDKGLTYVCHVLNQVDEHFIGDDMKLKEVILNILSNAIKFTDAPGTVTFTIEQTAVFENQVALRLVIKDTGIGMDKSFIPKIFESFAQEDSTRKNKYGSTGLGMAITKNIVEMMNGTINVESEKGVGTEFTVAVTLERCESQEGRHDGSVDLTNLRVLIVDDDEIAAEHAHMVLTKAGIRADVSLSAADALRMMEVQQLKQEPYNLVLMDWKMPEMDGLSATRQVREQYSSDATVVILTAYNWDEIHDEALEAGVDGFIAKPLFTANVIDELARIARRNDMSLFKEKKRAELAGRRILLAEDIEINADIMMDILDIEYVDADHAQNGKEAVEMFAESEPGTYDAILMDVRMPIMDGLEATAAIRDLDRPDATKIPIIALTANAFDEDVQQSLQAGMNAHLTKPVESEHLYQTLGELIYEAEHE